MVEMPRLLDRSGDQMIKRVLFDSSNTNMSTLKLQLLLLFFAGTSVSQTDWTTYVDVFIGTSGTVPGTSYNGGNVFPGAVVPFGAVKCGIE